MGKLGENGYENYHEVQGNGHGRRAWDGHKLYREQLTNKPLSPSPVDQPTRLQVHGDRRRTLGGGLDNNSPNYRKKDYTELR